MNSVELYNLALIELQRLEKCFPLGIPISLSVSDQMRATRGKMRLSGKGNKRAGHIRLSSFLKNDPTWVDTLRHEYAHMIVYAKGLGTGHDWRWKEICVTVGAIPTRCGQSMPDTAAKSKYTYKCACNTFYRKVRVKPGSYCKRCKVYLCEEITQRVLF